MQICHHSIYLKNNKIAFSGNDHVVVYKVNEKSAPLIGERDLIPIKSIPNKFLLIENSNFALLGLSCSNIQLIDLKENKVMQTFRTLVEEIYDITPTGTPWQFLVSGKAGIQFIWIDRDHLSIGTQVPIHFK